MTTPPATPAPTWTFERPWRNANPGDLRCLPDGQKWEGQIGVDYGSGGPFAIFETRTLGWRALAVCLLTYFERHGLNTIDGIIDRYAPPDDNNNTDGYKRLVCDQLGVHPADAIDPRKLPVMTALVSAIAIAEGSARIPWSVAEKAAGVQAALGIKASLPVTA